MHPTFILVQNHTTHSQDSDLNSHHHHHNNNNPYLLRPPLPVAAYMVSEVQLPSDHHRHTDHSRGLRSTLAVFILPSPLPYKKFIHDRMPLNLQLLRISSFFTYITIYSIYRILLVAASIYILIL